MTCHSNSFIQYPPVFACVILFHRSIQPSGVKIFFCYLFHLWHLITTNLIYLTKSSPCSLTILLIHLNIPNFWLHRKACWNWPLVLHLSFNIFERLSAATFFNHLPSWIQSRNPLHPNTFYFGLMSRLVIPPFSLLPLFHHTITASLLLWQRAWCMFPHY